MLISNFVGGGTIGSGAVYGRGILVGGGSSSHVVVVVMLRTAPV